MDVRRLLTDTCTITRVTADGPPDGHGNPTETTTTATAKCWLYRDTFTRTGGERQVQGDQQIEEFTLILEASAFVDGNDRVTVNGVTFEVVGPPWRAENPRTRVIDHVEAVLRRVI